VVVDPTSLGVQGSLIELPRRQLDMSFSQRIVKSLQAKFSVQNILNQSVGMVEDINFSYKYEKSHFVPAVQVPNAISYDGIEGDPNASTYKPGRFYVLTFTYGF
jgi:hypothetical protein